MKYLLNFIYIVVLILLSPFIAYRMAAQNRYRKGWKDRLGHVNRKYPDKKCVWIHAVSLGEVNAAKTIIEELHKRRDDLEIVVSTTTDTGFARASALYAKDLAIFFFPLDFSWVMRRAFNQLRPSVCLLMELEVWPNFVSTARKFNVPVVVVNGRISDRSFKKYLKLRPIVKNIFGGLSLILSQTQQYAERFAAIGANKDRITVTGSLKYDTAHVADNIDGDDVLAGELGLAGERLWVAGGTGIAEEQPIIDVYKLLRADDRFANLRLAIIPRKPERFEEVAELIRREAFDLVRYSELKGKGASAPLPPNAVILGDTMGDLRKFYSLGFIVFIGRSLVPMGGSDMMESAALKKCTIFGPHAFNFTQTVHALLSANGAIMVQDKQELFETMTHCLTDAAYTASIAANGQKVIIDNQGATQKTIEAVLKLL